MEMKHQGGLWGMWKDHKVEMISWTRPFLKQSSKQREQEQERKETLRRNSNYLAKCDIKDIH